MSLLNGASPGLVAARLPYKLPAPLGNGEHRAVALPATCRHKVVGREVCNSLELTQNLFPDSMPIHKITLILGSSRRSHTSLSDSPIFMIHQKP